MLAQRGIATKVARTFKKNKENLGFVAISHRFNPVKRILSAFIINGLQAVFGSFRRGEKANHRGLRAYNVPRFRCSGVPNSEIRTPSSELHV